jgi:hypothetical protein
MENKAIYPHNVNWVVDYFNAAGDRVGMTGFATEYLDIIDQVKKCFKGVPVIHYGVIGQIDQAHVIAVPKIKVERCSGGDPTALEYIDLDDSDRIAAGGVDVELERIKRKSIGQRALRDCHLYATAHSLGVMVWSRPYRFGGEGVTKVGLYSDCNADEALTLAASNLKPQCQLVAGCG